MTYTEMVASGETIGMTIDVNELLELIRGRYGDLDNECGCYCNGEWLSICDIVGMIINNAGREY